MTAYPPDRKKRPGPKRKDRSDRELGVDTVLDAVPTLTELAMYLGISPAAVSRWKRIPTKYVIDIERRFGVKRWQQRPDIYPPPGTTSGAVADNGRSG